jgi:hypothetical protein
MAEKSIGPKKTAGDSSLRLFRQQKSRGVSGPAAHVFYLNPSRKTSNGPRRYDDDDNDAYNYGDHARQV